MKVLCISASNIMNKAFDESTSIRLCKLIIEGLPKEQYTGEIVDLRTYKIQPCIGCGKCFETHRCVSDEAFNLLCSNTVSTIYCDKVQNIIKGVIYMIEQLKREDMSKIEHLFDGWEETLIWSCLQGYMGCAYADNAENPASAQVIVGDFCFFAGVPNAELTANIPCDFPSGSILMIPESDAWSGMIEKVYPSTSKKTLRYAIKKEADIFDREKLQSYTEGLSSEYTLKLIDETLYNLAKSEDWSCDLCSQFPSYRNYQAHGIGVMALFNGLPVSGASSYTVYDKGIEIEIDTRADFRRKGLALACGAKLILECMERNLYPSWDAHDLRSVSLAQKLGYHLDKEYITYIVSRQ